MRIRKMLFGFVLAMTVLCASSFVTDAGRAFGSSGGQSSCCQKCLEEFLQCQGDREFCRSQYNFCVQHCPEPCVFE